MAECRDSGIPADGAINNIVEVGSSLKKHAALPHISLIVTDFLQGNY